MQTAAASEREEQAQLDKQDRIVAVMLLKITRECSKV
jgi:hypothetical protein